MRKCFRKVPIGRLQGDSEFLFGAFPYFRKMESIDLLSKEKERIFTPLWPLSESVILDAVWAGVSRTDLGEDEICLER